MEKMITKRIAPGFYAGQYNGFKFQIAVYNPGTTNQWWGVTFLHPSGGEQEPNDESATKKQCLDDAKYMMDNASLYGLESYRKTN